MSVLHSSLYCRQNELREMVLEKQPDHHTAPVMAQTYFNTELKKTCIYTGEEWKMLAFGEDVPQGSTEGQLMRWNGTSWQLTSLYVTDEASHHLFHSYEDGMGFSFSSGQKTLFHIDGNPGEGFIKAFLDLDCLMNLRLSNAVHILSKSQNEFLPLIHRNATGLEVKADLHSIGTVNGYDLNFANWNTAYGWGNHALAGYAASNHNHDSIYAAIGHTEVEADSSTLGHVKLGTGFIVDEAGCLNVDLPDPDIWHTVIGSRASTTSFIFEGTAQFAKKIELSLVTCINSAGSTRRIGYIKTATESAGQITATVIADTDLADGDKNFNIALNRKVQDYLHMISIPGEQVADTSNSQGVWYLDVMKDSYLLPVDAGVRTGAAGSGASCAFNIYKGSTNLFTTAPDLGTATVLRGQRPNTNTISAGDHVSLRITASAGATNKASDFQAKLFIVPQNLFTAF